MVTFKDKYKFKKSMTLKEIRETSDNAFSELKCVYEYLSTKGRRELVILHNISEIAKLSQTKEEFISSLQMYANDPHSGNELVRKEAKRFLKQLQ